MNRTEMLRRLEKGEDPLEISIQKWQDIVDGKGKNDGDRNCALCERFSNSIFEWNDCGGCPIKRITKRRYCKNTPLIAYEHYSDYVDNFDVDDSILNALAQAELDFLKSLRKKEG